MGLTPVAVMERAHRTSGAGSRQEQAAARRQCSSKWRCEEGHLSGGWRLEAAAQHRIGVVVWGLQGGADQAVDPLSEQGAVPHSSSPTAPGGPLNIDGDSSPLCTKTSHVLPRSRLNPRGSP
jgi:hypothetical protein